MSKKYTLPRSKADKHKLYQWLVQDPVQEIDFWNEQYVKRRGRAPKNLREDFCGTALVSSEWVKDSPERTAIGLDLDAEVLDWGRHHNVNPLGEDAKRVDLRQKDVRSVTSPKADVVAAMNFSYFCFRPVGELINYFRFVRKSLAPGGIFVLDCYGGWESQQVVLESRKVDSPFGTFGYTWDQADYNPINNRTLCHIHFEFKGGKKWRQAFTYDWRLYTLPEIQDALDTAGFFNIEAFWDMDDDEDGCDYQPVRSAANTSGWIAYIIADAQSASSNGKKK